MTSWSDIQSHFLRLAELDAAGQEEALALLRAEAPALAEEVAALLAEEAALFPALQTDGPPAWQVTTQDLAGESIGPYRLQRLLGQGGMGAVYLAERADGEFEREVALKLIPRERLSEGALRRFRKERQLLARLQHPHIARLYDGGTAGEQVYFTLEYVEGQDLLQFAQTQQLSPRQRVELLLQVGEAIAYAHRQLILHLDLKPGNLLVNAEGQVKVLDFGISEESLSHTQQATGTLYTLAYASPEQLAGEGLSTASDVYGLGGLLWQLLTGELPYSPQDHPTSQAMLTAMEQGPPPRLTGDLDRICRRALANDPVDRYQQVEALMADLRAWLDRRPISLRPEPLYRLGRFLQRNWLLSTVTAAAFVLLLSLAGFYTWRLQAERNRALAEAAKTRQLINLLTGAFQAADPFVSQGDTLTARDILARATERMDTELAGQPELRAEMSVTLAGVYRALDQYELADSLIQAALKTYAAHPPTNPVRLAEAYTEACDIAYALGRYDQAQAWGDTALALLPQVAANWESRGDLYLLLGNLAMDRLAPEQADSIYQLAHELFRQNLNPPHALLAEVLHGLGDVNRRRQAFEASERYYQQALAMKEALYPPPNTEIAYTLNHLASLYYDQGEPAKGLPYAQASLEQRQAVLGPDHVETMASLSNLTRMYQQMGELEKALAIRRDLLERTRRVFGGEPHPYLMFHQMTIGYLLLELERPQQAEAAYRTTLALADTLDYGTTAPERVGVMAYQLGRSLQAQGKWEEALPELVRAEALLKGDVAKVARCWLAQARSYVNLREKEAARAKLRQLRGLDDALTGEMQAEIAAIGEGIE